MILNLSKIKTEALLLFCRDLIDAYSLNNDNIFNVDKDIEIYINDTIKQLQKAINQVIQPQVYYIDHIKNMRIKAIVKSYEYINTKISKHLSNGQQFNPAMLCFSLLTTWFAEFRYENKSKEFIYFTIYPYGNIYDKLLLDIKNEEYKALNITMIHIAEDTMIKLHNYSLTK